MRNTLSAPTTDEGWHNRARGEGRRARIAKAQGRSVTEWIGKTPEATPPPSVRLRILRRFDRRCQLTGIIIADGQPIDLEHEKPLEEGGENRERNLVPVLRLPHELKTAAQRKRQAKADRIARRARLSAEDETKEPRLRQGREGAEDRQECIGTAWGCPPLRADIVLGHSMRRLLGYIQPRSRGRSRTDFRLLGKMITITCLRLHWAERTKESRRNN